MSVRTFLGFCGIAVAFVVVVALTEIALIVALVR